MQTDTHQIFARIICVQLYYLCCPEGLITAVTTFARIQKEILPTSKQMFPLKENTDNWYKNSAVNLTLLIWI